MRYFSKQIHLFRPHLNLKLGALMFFVFTISTLHAQDPVKVKFDNLKDERIKQVFLDVVNQFDELDGYKITVVRQKIKSATMQAQPVLTFGSLFTGTKHYKIKLSRYVRDSDKIAVGSLPEDVLKGWFAHELGHIVDYAPYSSFQMITYGMKYLYSKRFKREAEYAADFIAIENGFSKEIIASKLFILENEGLSDSYKAKIKKYYMPIETVELCAPQKPLLPPSAEL